MSAPACRRRAPASTARSCGANRVAHQHQAHAACAVNLPENYLRGVVDGREPDVTEKIRFEEARHTAAPAALPTTEAAPKAGAAPPRTESAGVQSAPGAVTQEFCLQVGHMHTLAGRHGPHSCLLFCAR